LPENQLFGSDMTTRGKIWLLALAFSLAAWGLITWGIVSLN